MHRSLLVAALATLTLPAIAGAQSPASAATKVAAAGIPDIPYKKFTLKNGLTLLVHEDHKAPIVGGQHLVPRRLQERAPGQDRLRAPVRAPDVQRLRELQRRLLQGRSNRSARPTSTARPTRIAPTISRTCPCPRSTGSSGSSRTAWATWSAPSTRRSWTSSAAWCRTRSARARTSPTARRGLTHRREHLTRRAIRTRGPSSARWTT